VQDALAVAFLMADNQPLERAQVAHGAADVQQAHDAPRRDLEEVGVGVGAAGDDARPVLGAREAATREDGCERAPRPRVIATHS
jgi:hypothetical protein